MKIELRAVRYAAFASQETACYQAKLYVNGRRIGEVSNDGHGGPDTFHGNRNAYEAADAWCRANLPKWSLADDAENLHETDLKVHCGDLLTAWLYRRDYQRAVRSKVLLHHPGKRGIFEFPHRGAVERVIKAAKALHPQAVILNELPVDEAVAIYRSNAG